MADIKISELTQVSALNNGDLVEVSQVNALAPSGYTSLKASMTDLGKKVNSDIEYTTDLADFTDKTITGAIKETAKGKNVADEYDDTQTYDKGDVVIYKNTLYICNTNNTTGDFDPSKWTATTIDNVIGDLSTLTTSVTSSLVGAVNEVDSTKADKAWTYIDKINLNGTCSVSGYSEVLIILYVNNNRNRESFVYPISELSEDTEMHSIIVNSSANVTNYANATVKVASNTLTYTGRSLVGWNSLYLKVYAR